ncbi:hypothetical protein [Streptomyces sp. NPDC053431]|uniref:hypothetical protein n=1 Tax=Streptomyces sp. NPDC053431 TaxID=3365703 RepID=UPI0037D58922
MRRKLLLILAAVASSASLVAAPSLAYAADSGTSIAKTPISEDCYYLEVQAVAYSFNSAEAVDVAISLRQIRTAQYFASVAEESKFFVGSNTYVTDMTNATSSYRDSYHWISRDPKYQAKAEETWYVCE